MESKVQLPRNFTIHGSIEQTVLDSVEILAARSSTVHNMQDAAARPTDG